MYKAFISRRILNIAQRGRFDILSLTSISGSEYVVLADTLSDRVPDANFDMCSVQYTQLRSSWLHLPMPQQVENFIISTGNSSALKTFGV